MGRLRTVLGKLLGKEAPSEPRDTATPSAEDSARPPVAAVGEASGEPQSDGAGSISASEKETLTPITELKYLSATDSADFHAAPTDQIVMIYNGRNLVFDVSDEMSKLDTTEFVSRLIDQAYEKYELLFDTDDVFQIVVLLKQARPPAA
jgi:hypothetical protein